MGTSKATAPRPRARSGPGTYFLSLTVENVRCFGPAQTLDLSDGHGRHTAWTIILGENGLGKTTLLTCLAAIPNTGYPDQAESNARMLWEETNLEAFLRGSGEDQGQFRAAAVYSAGLKGQVKLK